MLRFEQDTRISIIIIKYEVFLNNPFAFSKMEFTDSTEYRQQIL